MKSNKKRALLSFITLPPSSVYRIHWFTVLVVFRVVRQALLSFLLFLGNTVIVPARHHVFRRGNCRVIRFNNRLSF